MDEVVSTEAVPPQHELPPEESDMVAGESSVTADAEEPAQTTERTESSDLYSVEAVSSMEITPLGSPLGSKAPSVSDEAGGANTSVDVSRAGRKRKANARYMEAPSPVIRPAVRKPSISGKKVAAPPSPRSKKLTKGEELVKAEELLPAPIVTGPPTFGSILFGRRRKLSDSLSDVAPMGEEEIPDLVSEEEEEEEEEEETVAPNAPISEHAPNPVLPVKLEGNYLASGAAGPTVHGMIKTALVFPTDGTIKFPDIVSEEYLASRAGRARVSMPVELGGGGPLSLLPSAPLVWFRDEIPKLSAYFRKKMEGSAPAAKAVHAVPAGEKKVSLTEAQREERRRQKEAERRRIIEERNRRRERERLKQLYRQHWLALTKFPIEDDLLHSHKGIRRLGHASPQCRKISHPIVHWDCRLGGAGALEVPLSTDLKTTELLDEIFVVYNFFVHFSSLLLPNRRASSPVSLPVLVEGIFRKELTVSVASVHWDLIEILRPWLEHQIATMLQAEQALESQLTKNRGRAKMYWNSICQYRDFLFLGYSVFVNKVVSAGGASWLWQCLFIAKTIVLLDAIECRSKEFLSTISSAFEEMDFEHKWIFDWEIGGSAWKYECMPFEYRVKLLKLLVDKIVALPVVKKAVDLSCEARSHVTAELAFLDKEERKLTQRIALNQKLLNLQSEVVASDSPELLQDLRLRDAIGKAKRVTLSFVDKELAVRLESLGRDRHMNEYFQVTSDRNLVFVRQHSVSHPNVIRYGIYDSLANIEALIQSLDERGVREMNLKAELQKVKTTIFSSMMALGDSDFEKPSVDWLADNVHALAGPHPSEHLREEAKEFVQLKFLSECIDLTRSGFVRIKEAWFGRSSPSTDDLVDDDDDVTVDEGMMSSSSSASSSSEDKDIEEEVESNLREFRTEEDSLFDSITRLADIISEGFKSALLAYPKPGESVGSSSSILIQFHVKTGVDFLRQVSIPADKVELTRLLEGLNCVQRDSAAEYKRKMIQIASVFLDGLSALDEVVHAEIARLESSAVSLEIWAASGGEKHAWKSFIGFSEQQLAPASPGGEEQEENEEKSEPAMTASASNSFKCDSCEKNFKYHILLGMHKLNPCKTRGRKPLPVDPLMEVFPLSSSNGMLAVDRINNPELPSLPSARQEAAEKAEKSDEPTTLPAEFVCDICGKVFPHNQGLAVHQTRWCIPEQQAQLILTAQQAVGGLAAPPVSDTDGPVNCPTCGKLFPTLQGLTIHQTRWCQGDPSTSRPASKILHVEPIFRKPDLPRESLVSLENGPTEEDGSETRREPGFTPACYSLAAISVAISWYATRLDAVVKKFSSERPHHSRAGAHKSSSKSKK